MKMPIYQCGESNPCGWQIELSEDNAELKQRITALEAENAKLRAALVAVEFVYDDVCGYCPWCNANDKDRIIGDDNYVIQHKPDCQFRAALAQTQEVKA